MFRYSVVIKWSDEDEGYIGTVPELPGLSAFGETYEDALSELECASEAFVEALKESGKALPEPQKQLPYSGQLRVRMPKSLHAKLAASAEDEGISLNTYIVSLLSERQGEKQTMKQLSSKPIVVVKAGWKKHREAAFNYPQKTSLRAEKSSENWGEYIGSGTKGGYN
jgi:antitoxin HicB